MYLYSALHEILPNALNVLIGSDHLLISSFWDGGVEQLKVTMGVGYRAEMVTSPGKGLCIALPRNFWFSYMKMVHSGAFLHSVSLCQTAVYDML